MINQAIKKIITELQSFEGGKIEKVIKNRCAEVLQDFCRQEQEIAQAIVQSDKTFSNCMTAVAKNVKDNSISDIDAFRAMVQFYFPTADIHMHMTIDTCGNIPGAPPIIMSNGGQSPKPETKKSLTLSFDDLFDD